MNSLLFVFRFRIVLADPVDWLMFNLWVTLKKDGDYMYLAEKICSAVVFALSIVIGLAGMNFRLWEEYGPGAGLWPLMIALGWFIVSIIWFFDANSLKESGKTFTESKKNFMNIVLVMGSFGVYAVLLGFLGFVISTIAFMMFILVCQEKYSIVRGLIISGCVSIGLFLMFEVWLTVPLPHGFLGFI